MEFLYVVRLFVIPTYMHIERTFRTDVFQFSLVVSSALYPQVVFLPKFTFLEVLICSFSLTRSHTHNTGVDLLKL